MTVEEKMKHCETVKVVVKKDVGEEQLITREVDVDMGIAHAVRKLNEVDGILTHGSCQGRSYYAPYVAISWRTDELKQEVLRMFPEAKLVDIRHGCTGRLEF